MNREQNDMPCSRFVIYGSLHNDSRTVPSQVPPGFVNIYVVNQKVLFCVWRIFIIIVSKVTCGNIVLCVDVKVTLSCSVSVIA